MHKMALTITNNDIKGPLMFEPTKETLIAFLQRKLNVDYCRKHSFIASETGVSQSTISRIAKGRAPNLDAAQSLLDYFIKDNTPAPKKGAGK